MKVKEIEDVNSVIQLHEKIFNKPFPLQSYYKKNSIYKVDIYVYEENSNLLGYSIVVDQEKEKNFYAWYGGVLPKFQGRGITEKFFKVLIPGEFFTGGICSFSIFVMCSIFIM